MAELVSPARPRRFDPRSLAEVAIAAGLGFAAYLLVPAAASVLRDSDPLRALMAGGVVALGRRRGLSLAGSVVAALLAAAAGEFVIASLSGTPAPMHVLLDLALAGGCASAVHRLASGAPEWAERTVLMVALVGFLWVGGALPGVYRDSLDRLLAQWRTEPRPEQYDFDGRLYLRTYFLMKRGEPYYRAFATAYAGDARHLGPPDFKLNYREPLLFEIWRWLPGRTGASVRSWFLAFAALVLVAGYRLARRFAGPGCAMLAPLGLSAYFAGPAWSIWFLFTEVWAGGTAVIAMALLSRGRWRAGALLLGLATGIRELMVYLLPAFLMGWFLDRTRPRDRVALALGLALPAVLIAGHLVLAPGRFELSRAALAPWLHGGLAGLLESLRFGSAFVVLGPNLLLCVPVAAVAAAAGARPAARAVLLAGAVGAGLLGLFAFGSGPLSLYWGAILQPLALAVAPLALAPLDPADAPA